MQTVNLQQLQERLERLLRGRGKLISDLNAQDGAIQECEYWIQQLSAAEPSYDGSGLIDAQIPLQLP